MTPDDTTILNKLAELPPTLGTLAIPDTLPNGNGSSAIFGVSLRGWLALTLVGTLCGIVIGLHTDKIVDAFLIIVSGAVTFYFGQNGKR